MKRIIIFLTALSINNFGIAFDKALLTSLVLNPSIIQFRNCKSWDLCSLDESFIKMIAMAFKAPIFVETGTFRGDSTERASRYFPFIHTIELANDLFELCQNRFKGNSSITLHHGDSALILQTIVPILDKKAVFFLDAHNSGGGTAKGETNTPILTEIRTVLQKALFDPILVIDDTRMFYEPLCNVEGTIMEGYPSLIQVVDTILAIKKNYKFALISDVLVAYPSSEPITISPIVQAITISRLFDGSNFTLEDIIKAEYCIAHAEGSEREAIKILAEFCTEQWTKAAGYSRHYPLWYGLILLANGEYEKAYGKLLEAKQRGINDWRIERYLSMAQSHYFSLINA